MGGHGRRVNTRVSWREDTATVALLYEGLGSVLASAGGESVEAGGKKPCSALSLKHLRTKLFLKVLCGFLCGYMTIF